jgi:tRNA modification GTPase
MLSREDVIAARATPPGSGAIAVVRISGPGALAIADKVVDRTLSDRASHTAHLRNLVDAEGRFDEALAVVFKGPKSYTGDDTVEFSVHGSDYIVQRLLKALYRAGARPAEAGEFTFRAFFNGKLDLAQAEGVADLIAADSAAAHRAAFHQLKGGVSKDIGLLREQLIKFAALIELELDFGEEDVEFAGRSELRELLNSSLFSVRDLMKSFELGNAVKEGIQVVLAGRPNAGKSTLFNLLLQEDRAIVSDIAGTTRDALEDRLVIDGIRFRLIDTAGIREATDTIEKLGIERTYRHISGGALTLLVFDLTSASKEQLGSDVAEIKARTGKVICIGNKLDLTGRSENEIEAQWGDFLKGLGVEAFIAVSGLIEGHREHLKGILRGLVAADDLHSDRSMVTSLRHFHALQRSEQSLMLVMQALDNGLTGDLLASDLREALNALGEVTGQVSSEDLLDYVFSKFCIGK